MTESERKQRSIVGIEMAHRPRYLVALRQAGRAVGNWWRLVEAEGHDPACLLPPARVYRCIDGDSTEPGRPALRVTQSGQLAPGTHECLLERVLGVEGVAQDGQAQPERVWRLELDQIHECVAVSGPGCND